jgi:hypothetical protein
MRKWCPIWDAHGFSLIEAMIAILIGSISVAGVVKLVHLSVKTERNSVMNSEQLELTTRVRQIASIPASCTVNLKGVVLNTTTMASSPITLNFPEPDPTNPAILIKGAPIIAAGTYGKLNVDGFQVVPYARLRSDLWLVKIVVSTHKTGEHLAGTDKSSEISAQVKVDPATSTIIECLALGTDKTVVEGTDPSLNQKICHLASNGASTYDATTGVCVSTVTCYDGTAASAACPTGHRVMRCTSGGAVDLLYDPLNPPVREYPGGVVIEDKAPLYYCNIDTATHTAACTYALNTDITNAHCRACCAPPTITEAPAP